MHSYFQISLQSCWPESWWKLDHCNWFRHLGLVVSSLQLMCILFQFHLLVLLMLSYFQLHLYLLLFHLLGTLSLIILDCCLLSQSICLLHRILLLLFLCLHGFHLQLLFLSIHTLILVLLHLRTFFHLCFCYIVCLLQQGFCVLYLFHLHILLSSHFQEYFQSFHQHQTDFHTCLLVFLLQIVMIHFRSIRCISSCFHLHRFVLSLGWSLIVLLCIRFLVFLLFRLLLLLHLLFVLLCYLLLLRLYILWCHLLLMCLLHHCCNWCLLHLLFVICLRLLLLLLSLLDLLGLLLCLNYLILL